MRAHSHAHHVNHTVTFLLWLQVSGVSFTFDPSRPAMDRILPDSVCINGKPVVAEALYSVSTKAYLATGKVGCKLLGVTTILNRCHLLTCFLLVRSLRTGMRCLPKEKCWLMKRIALCFPRSCVTISECWVTAQLVTTFAVPGFPAHAATPSAARCQLS